MTTKTHSSAVHWELQDVPSDPDDHVVTNRAVSRLYQSDVSHRRSAELHRTMVSRDVPRFLRATQGNRGRQMDEPRLHVAVERVCQRRSVDSSAKRELFRC